MQKKWLTYTGILLGILLLGACEDVIEVTVPEEPPRLVVEGLLRVDIEETFVPVEIKLSQSAGFFGEVVPVTDAENVIIILQEFEDGVATGTTFTRNLAQVEPGSGIYVPDPSFDNDQRIPTSLLERDFRYTLVIEWRERRYAALTTYAPAVPISSLEQGDETLFGGDETEVIIRFTDDPDRDNYYVFDFGFGNFLPSIDTFYQGQEFSFSYFYDQTFESGETIEVSILGADQQFFNYMSLLVEQAASPNDPFQSPVATVRGNVFDATDIDNIENFDTAGTPEVFPLGYFAIVQEYRETLTIE